MAMRYPGGLIATSPVNAAYPSGVWTQSQTIPYASQNVWQRDQYWRNTTLLLHGDGTNGAQNNTFLDSGTANSGSGFTITRNGNTTQGSFTPFQQNGYWSNYFDGSGDYLNTATNVSGFDFGTGDFTVECWVYHLALSSQCVIFYGVPSSGSLPASDFGWAIDTASSNTPRFFFYSGSTQVTVSAAQTMPVNQWVHYAVTRASGSLKFFINGTQSGSTVSSSASVNTNTTFATRIGLYGPYGDDRYFNGYMSSLRVVKGTAIYTSNFTPPTAPLTAISGTSLLTCQSNRFVDNSASPLTLTVNGNTSVQAFQPFPGPTTWSASIGGSGYFDGSGDYLTVPDNAAFTLGSGDFTIECWAYWTGSGQQRIIAQADSGGNNVSFVLGTTSANKAIGRVLVSTTAYDATSSADLVVNQWNHIAFVRNGSTLRLYINGVQDGTNGTISTQSVFDSSYQIGIGRPGELNAEYFKGYVSSLRFVKGTCVYPSGTTFTPPTAPLTNISNTSLLLNFTNAGIFDNAQMNNLETVGNAQVSTSVVKYGTGSMAFDGSGDYLVGRTTDLLSFNTGDFTVEMWVYPNSVAGNIVLIDTRSSGTDSGWAFYINSSSKLALFTSNADRITAGSALSASTWTHVVLARSGSTLAIYMNGVQSATATYSTTMTCPGRISIASGFDNAAPLNGYIDDMRITKGVARYISNFTPPIARMPNQ